MWSVQSEKVCRLVLEDLQYLIVAIGSRRKDELSTFQSYSESRARRTAGSYNQ